MTTPIALQPQGPCRLFADARLDIRQRGEERIDRGTVADQAEAPRRLRAIGRVGMLQRRQRGRQHASAA